MICSLLPPLVTMVLPRWSRVNSGGSRLAPVVRTQARSDGATVRRAKVQCDGPTSDGPSDKGRTMSRVVGLISVVMLLVAGRLMFAAGSVPVGKAEDVGLSTEGLKRISQGVDRHLAAGNVAGAVTLVARRGKIAHFEAQGVMDVDTKKPMAKDNLFRLASMSKPITGVAIMMLV